jgi:hypothetical protein
MMRSKGRGSEQRQQQERQPTLQHCVKQSPRLFSGYGSARQLVYCLIRCDYIKRATSGRGRVRLRLSRSARAGAPRPPPPPPPRQYPW